MDKHRACCGEQLHQRVGYFLAQLNVVGALPRHWHINVLETHGFHDLLLLGQHAKSKLAGLVLTSVLKSQGPETFTV